MTTKKTSLLPGYSSSIIDINGKKRYNSKIDVICGIDPYEIPENEWQDNIDLWPAVTHIHVGMYLLLTPSVYSNEDLLNYKSMESYINFLSGWVRKIYVKEFGSKRLLKAGILHVNFDQFCELPEA